MNFLEIPRFNLYIIYSVLLVLTHCVWVYLTMGLSQERQLNLSTSCLEVNRNTTLIHFFLPGQRCLETTSGSSFYGHFPPSLWPTTELIHTFLKQQRRHSPDPPEPAASGWYSSSGSPAASLLSLTRSCSATETSEVNHRYVTVSTPTSEEYLPYSPSHWRACPRLCASPAPGRSPCSEAPLTWRWAAQNQAGGGWLCSPE